MRAVFTDALCFTGARARGSGVTGDGDGVVGMGVGGKVALPEVGDAVKHGGYGHIESLGAGVRLVCFFLKKLGSAPDDERRRAQRRVSPRDLIRRLVCCAY